MRHYIKIIFKYQKKKLTLHIKKNQSSRFSTMELSIESKIKILEENLEAYKERVLILELEKRVNELEKNIYIYMKTIENNMKKTTNVMKRKSTLAYEKMKDVVDLKDIDQPIYTPEDDAKKQKIFGYINGQSAFSNKKVNPNKGDHMYGIRERVSIDGIVGSNTKWNMISCSSSENSGEDSWKKVKFLNKNIVYDNFTEEEISNFDPITKENYKKFSEWKKYAESRGALLFYTNMKNIDEEIQKKVEKYLIMLDSDNEF